MSLRCRAVTLALLGAVAVAAAGSGPALAARLSAPGERTVNPVLLTQPGQPGGVALWMSGPDSSRGFSSGVARTARRVLRINEGRVVTGDGR